MLSPSEITEIECGLLSSSGLSDDDLFEVISVQGEDLRKKLEELTQDMEHKDLCEFESALVDYVRETAASEGSLKNIVAVIETFFSTCRNTTPSDTDV